MKKMIIKSHNPQNEERNEKELQTIVERIARTNTWWVIRNQKKPITEKKLFAKIMENAKVDINIANQRWIGIEVDSVAFWENVEEEITREITKRQTADAKE